MLVTSCADLNVLLTPFSFQVSLLSCPTAALTPEVHQWHGLPGALLLSRWRKLLIRLTVLSSPTGSPGRQILSFGWHKLLPCHSLPWELAPEVLWCQLLAEIGRIWTFLISVSFYVSVEAQVKWLYNSMPFSPLFQCCRIWVLFLSKRV